MALFRQSASKSIGICACAERRWVHKSKFTWHPEYFEFLLGYFFNHYSTQTKRDGKYAFKQPINIARTLANEIIWIHWKKCARSTRFLKVKFANVAAAESGGKKFIFVRLVAWKMALCVSSNNRLYFTTMYTSIRLLQFDSIKWSQFRLLFSLLKIHIHQNVVLA